MPAEQQFTLVLDNPKQMDDLREQLQITPVRKALEAAAEAGRISNESSVDVDRDGSLVVSSTGDLASGHLVLQVSSITHVLQKAGFQVTPDDEEPNRAVRATPAH